jgi:hypothetical protein
MFHNFASAALVEEHKQQLMREAEHRRAVQAVREDCLDHVDIPLGIPRRGWLHWLSPRPRPCGAVSAPMAAR